MISGTTIDAGTVLAAARRARAEADAAQAVVFSQALAWAHLHVVDEDTGVVATWGDSPVPLAGEGAPLVSEFCIHEFATALGMSAEAGRSLIADALELHHRLPRVWHRIQNGSLPVWRARRIADQTVVLTPEAAEYVDRQVAPHAHRISVKATERLVAEAIARFMPTLADEIAERALDARHLTIEHQQVSFHGTSQITGELDLADALDLEAALQQGAQQLADLGIDAHLDARRAMALGALARGDQAIEYDAPDFKRSKPRQVVLYVHLSESALNSNDGLVRVENNGGHLLTQQHLAAWCGVPDTQITVKPVIDLNDHIAVAAYEIPDRLREQVILRDPTCVFPWCNRSSRSCDLDHIEPYDPGGTTSSDNLAPLCRRHHRLKTFGGWAYSMIEPGTYLWRSPHGYSYLRDGTGTRDLTPRPVDPPGR